MQNLDDNQLIPEKNPTYVPWGHHEDIKKIIESKIFYPLYVTGLSGNGKTMMVEQICAELNRPMIRVNITEETEEDDLLGGFRLVKGETVWHHGPLVRAMQTGSILLLDEVDLGSKKILCLQPSLEGKGIFLKKINEFITPAPGFNIIATANTKGQGDTGKFIGTNQLNEAFLERFAITFEQLYPNKKIEKQILTNVLKQNKKTDSEFVGVLLNWASDIRKAFFENAYTEIISTRRLVHIISAYCVFSDRKKAVELCISRFDEQTKMAFLQLYDNLIPSEDLDEKAKKEAENKKPKKEETIEEFDPSKVVGGIAAILNNTYNVQTP